MKIYLLEKMDKRKRWRKQGYYKTYKLAEQNFVYLDGFFRIKEIEVKE